MATGSSVAAPLSEEPCVPDYDSLVTEDDKPVDNVYSAWQHLLLTAPLVDSWPGPGGGCPRFVCSDVGLFYSDKEPAYAPDVLISLHVSPPQGDLSKKENRSYYMWKYEKPPDALIEVVSNTVGGELTTKLTGYARIGVTYYIVWDPFQFLGKEKLHCFALERGKYVSCQPWFPELELGVKVWPGVYGEMQATFLRWCDQQGNVIPTGAERAERLAAKLRELGVDPERL